MIRVFIVAASSLVRTGLQSLLSDREIEVVGSIADFESLTGQWLDVQGDVILVEASGDQFETVMESLAMSQLAFEASVMVLTDHREPKLLADALRSGVRAFLPSDIPADQLVAALKAVTSGLVVVHAADAGVLFPAAETASRPLAELAEPLTQRENEVLQMLASGLANKEIASRLKISEHTVKFHVASILGKLGASSRTEAVSLGIRRGLVLL